MPQVEEEEVKPTAEEVAMSMSVDNPVVVFLTPNLFVKHAMDTLVKDLFEKASYVKTPFGYKRETNQEVTKVKVARRISSCFFLCTSGEIYLAVRTDGDDSLLDDTTYTLNLEDTGEIYPLSYLGSTKRIRVCTVVKPIDPEIVMRRFRSGERFKLPIETQYTIACEDCDGTGFMEIKMSQRGGTRKTICTTCKGLKKTKKTAPLIHLISCAPPYIIREKQTLPDDRDNSISAP